MYIHDFKCETVKAKTEHSSKFINSSFEIDCRKQITNKLELGVEKLKGNTLKSSESLVVTPVFIV